MAAYQSLHTHQLIFKLKASVYCPLMPRFGELPLAAIEPSHVRSWVAELVDKGYAASTVRRAYILFQMALELAVDEGLIPRSPCRRVSLPQLGHNEKRFLDPTEVAQLADAIQDQWRAFVLAGAYTGLRPGELAALRTDRLDLDAYQLRVEEPLKTPAARRTVTFPHFLADEFARHLTRYPAASGLVFTAPEGGPIRVSSWRRRFWYPAVDASVGRPMRPHDLRHTHVALLIAEGEDPYVISKRLGHASIRTTYDTYGHLFKGRDRQAADRLEQVYRRSLTDTRRTVQRPSDIGLEL
ncbi:MAG: tyrosine-type recombinase/integrase [Acidimicrobiia bacterium]